MPEITLESIKAAMLKAIQGGNDAELMVQHKALSTFKADIAKAEQERARKENEALAGVREKLAIEIHKAVSKFPMLGQLKDVKAHGFTFKLDNSLEPGVSYKSVALLVPVSKASKAGTGSGKHGKSSTEYGKTLEQIFQEFATAEDREKLAAAEGNSAQWAVKNSVKKHAIAEGKLKPIS